jgi:hypothetical protein
MKIIIYWNDNQTEELYNKVVLSLDELWLWEFIDLEKSENTQLKDKLKITKTPALIVEEENIDFVDTIFEWIIPTEEEIKSMIISIIWGWTTPNCASPECGVTCMC